MKPLAVGLFSSMALVLAACSPHNADVNQPPSGFANDFGEWLIP